MKLGDKITIMGVNIEKINGEYIIHYNDYVGGYDDPEKLISFLLKNGNIIMLLQ